MLAVHYDYWLVAVSVFIAVCAAYVALDLAERVTAAEARLKALWIVGGACVIGNGIWSIHYIGMLSLQLPVVVQYDVRLLLLSRLAAVLSAGVALSFATRKTHRPRELLIGGLAVSGSIVSMHYIGMAGMRMHCTCSYDWRVVGLSVLLGLVVSSAGLVTLRSRSRFAGSHRFAAAILLGVAISCMHYTEMAAAQFWHTEKTVDFSSTIAVSWLDGIVIAAWALLVLGIAMLISIADKYFSAQSLRLQWTEERYRLLFERSLAGIYRATVQAKIIDMNEACVELLGYSSRDEVLGKVIRDLHMPEEDRQPYLSLLLGNKGVPGRETRLYRTDGTTMWVMHSATLLESHDGSPPEIQGMLITIDQLKRTENELRSAKHAAESASRSKSQFLANISHELRTPLNGIIGMAQVLSESELSAEQREYVDLVRISADSLLGSINHVLAFSTSGGMGSSSDGEEFDLREVIATEAAIAAAAGRPKGLKLAFEIATDVGERFWGEPRWLRQIVSSLFSNAVKFTPKGEIEVKVASRGRLGPNQIVSISVRDTGVGIARDQQKMVFEAFYQVDNSSTRRFGGTGLGLSIVRNLTEAMGGQISVESQPGKGSTFLLQIPLLVRPDRLPVALKTPEISGVQSWTEASAHAIF